MRSGLFSTSGNTEPKQKNQFSRSLAAIKQTQELWEGVRGGSRSRVLKSQVCSCNKRLCSLLPEPPPNEAIAVVTDGNCRRDGQTPPDRVIEVNPRGQRAVSRPKVLVNFGKQRSVPLLPIRELSALLLPLKHASASLRPLVPRGSGGGPRD